MNRAELIEKVARAIYPKAFNGTRGYSEEIVAIALANTAADTIFAAMLEPTEAMLENSYKWDEYIAVIESHPYALGIWRAMLHDSPLAPTNPLDTLALLDRGLI